MAGPVSNNTTVSRQSATRTQAPAQTKPEAKSDTNLTSVADNTAKGLSVPGAVKDSYEALNGAGSAPTGLQRLSGVAGTAGGLLATGAGVASANESIRKAAKTGDPNDIAKATADTAGAASSTVGLAKTGLETAADLASRPITRQAAEAFKQAAPTASKEVVDAAAKAATQGAVEGAKDKLVRRGAVEAAEQAAKATSTLARGAGVAGRQAAKQVLKEGGEAAAKAATKAAARSAAGGLAKAAGRFAPGANIAIAALDTANAAATLADKNASTGKKVTSVITAAGSIAAATNIPVVSQVGAAVSTVSSIVGAFF